MQSTREQRRSFIKTAKKKWKKGEMNKAEFLQLKAQINAMGNEQHADLQRTLLENKSVDILESNHDILDIELEDDFAPEDI